MHLSTYSAKVLQRRADGGTLLGFHVAQYKIPATFPFSIVLFGNLVQAEEGFISAVVLNAQTSRRSLWSTRGMARCGLFSILWRISPWFLQSLMAARGNTEAQAGTVSIVHIMEQ